MHRRTFIGSVASAFLAAPLVVDAQPTKRASDAMMKMVKIDIAALRAAFAGTTGAREQAR